MTRGGRSVNWDLRGIMSSNLSLDCVNSYGVEETRLLFCDQSCNKLERVYREGRVSWGVRGGTWVTRLRATLSLEGGRVSSCCCWVLLYHWLFPAGAYCVSQASHGCGVGWLLLLTCASGAVSSLLFNNFDPTHSACHSVNGPFPEWFTSQDPRFRDRHKQAILCEKSASKSCVHIESYTVCP